MSARQIKAGGAFVEITANDKTGDGLARAQSRLAIFARGVKTMSTALAGGLRAIGHGMTYVGTAVAAAGAGILAVLGKSVKTFLEVSAHAKAMGKSIAGIDPAKAERLSNAIETLKAVWGAIQLNIGSAVAEPLTNLLMVLIRLGTAAANFIKANPQLVVTIAAVGAVALVAGLAIAGLGTAFILAASAVAGIASVLTALATPVGAVVAIIAALAAVALLAAGAFVVLAESTTGVFSGLLAALATGDIIQAWFIVAKAMESIWKIMALGIEMVWTGMIARITKAMDDLIVKSGLLQGLFGGAGAGIAGTVVNRGASIASSAIQTGANARQTAAAFDLAATMVELARLNQQARDNFMRGFAGAGITLPDLAQLTNSGNRQGFGVTGSTNATTAGQNRTLGGIEKEQKKTNDHLDRILQVLKGVKAEGALEFAP